MIQVRLTEDKSWRGQIYLAGDRLIPDDLAIALGLNPVPTPPTTSKSLEQIKIEAQDDEPTVIEPPEEPAKPPARRKRGQ